MIYSSLIKIRLAHSPILNFLGETTRFKQVNFVIRLVPFYRWAGPNIKKRVTVCVGTLHRITLGFKFFFSSFSNLSIFFFDLYRLKFESFYSKMFLKEIKKKKFFLNTCRLFSNRNMNWFLSGKFHVSCQLSCRWIFYSYSPFGRSVSAF